MKKCKNCGIYTLKPVCPKCGKATVTIQLPKYSPEDKYGKWRRVYKKLIKT